MKCNIEIKRADGVELVQIKNFECQENKINVLFGESGIGKSLIHQKMYGLLEKSELQSKTIRTQLNPAFYVFQEPSSHLNPAMRLNEQVNEGSIDGDFSQEKLFGNLLENETMASFLALFPKGNQPSGGEKQRIHLLMSLKRYVKFIESQEKTAFFVFDEATAHLDEKNRDRFFDVLLSLWEKKAATISLITHDYSIIEYFKNKKRDVFYSELKKSEGRLYQEKFNEKKYFSEMNSLKLIRMNASGKSLLRLESDIQIYDLELTFSKNKKATCLELKEGQISYLKSESGGGKTTVSNLLMGIIKAKSFKCRIKDFELTEKTEGKFWAKELWGKEISMLFQNADDVLNPESRIYESLNDITRMSKSACLNELEKLFDDVDASFLDRKIKSLSGGQKQRINILRSLLIQAPIIILDEPLKGLDFDSIQKVLLLIQELQKSQKSILLISHHEQIFDRLIPKSYHLYLEKIKNYK